MLYAYSNTWGKTDLDVKLHINDSLVRSSSFGEPPTFAIWLENPDTKEIRAVYVTRRAAEGDWEGKTEVPVALPKWFEARKTENGKKNTLGVDAFSGATPKPGYFTAKASLDPGSMWICWIEVNLAGDFNEFYKGNNVEENESDKFLSGQPALLYMAGLNATVGFKAKPELIGMCVLGAPDGEIVQPLKGITTAYKIFDELTISVVKPKPKIVVK
ncbi:MAG: hypothetical protein HC905_03760 [Bacteroidales bacterium]|nr:hypothetical protein [Bacteroidales bacterium]